MRDVKNGSIFDARVEGMETTRLHYTLLVVSDLHLSGGRDSKSKKFSKNESLIGCRIPRIDIIGAEIGSDEVCCWK